MQFNNSLSLFQHLLTLGEDKLNDNLIKTITPSHAFYKEVQALIAAHYANKEATLFKSIINEQASNLVDDKLIHQLEGKQLGYYQLSNKIGQGGMGVVYLAERNDGLLEQRVAIKFVFPSIAALAGEDFLRKEAQHLANLEHPNIARIYTIDNYVEENSASLSSNNIPYMIMEYIEGTPIDKYCNDNNLNLNARLKLFQKVCYAVNFAHQNMILHSDIKPSNILVDNTGEPKLMDFGIARSLNQSNDEINGEETKQHHLNAASGDYASPEQLKGEKLTTASDVYSLGKVLQSLALKPNKEILALIDKALLTNYKKRYQSVFQLIEEIKAYLKNKPIKSYNAPFYHLIKFIQRNKLSSSLSFVFLLGLTTFAFQTHKHNQALAQEKLVLEKVTTFIIESFKAVNPENAEKENTTALDVLNKAKNSITTIKDIEPEVKGKILYSIASAYSGAGETQIAIDMLKEIVSYPNQNQTKIQLKIASNLLKQSHYKQALKAVNLALKTEPKTTLLYGQSLGQKGAILMLLDQHKAALKLLLNAIKIISDKRSSLDPDIAIIHNQIANIYNNLGNFKKVFEHSKLAYDISQKIYPSSSPKMSSAILSMAHAYSVIEDYDNNAKFTLKALNIDKKIYGKNHPRIIIISNNLGNAYSKIGKFKEAAAIHQEAISATIKLFGKKHIDYIYGNAYLGNALSRLHQYKKALIAYKESYQSSLELFGEKHHTTLTAQKNLGESYLENGEVKLANKMLIQTLQIAKTVYDSKHPRLAMVKLATAKTYNAIGKYNKALQLASSALSVFKNHYKNDGEYITDTVNLITEIKKNMNQNLLTKAS